MAWPDVIFPVLTAGLLSGIILRRLVIRLPLMLEWQWRAEEAEIQGRQFDEPPISLLGIGPNGGGLRFPSVEIGAVGCVLSAASALQGVHIATGSVFLLAIFALALIDLRHKLLPDLITQPLLWLGLLVGAFGVGFVSLAEGVFGAAVGYLSLLLLALVYQFGTGHEGIAPGDFKMLAAIGAWLGWKMLLPVVAIAFLASGIIGVGLIATGRLQRSDPLPFGPFLAIGGACGLLAYKPLLDLLTLLV